jgi:hypothetical protein
MGFGAPHTAYFAVGTGNTFLSLQRSGHEAGPSDYVVLRLKMFAVRPPLAVDLVVLNENSGYLNLKFFKNLHHHTTQINQPTRRNNLSSLLLDVYVQLNVFRASPRPSSGAQQLQ